MNIGIIGLGVVGQACKQGFLSVGHTISESDPKLGTTIDSVLHTDIVYICVPTPDYDNGCDTRTVDKIIIDLKQLDYQGVVAIKSTVPPGHTDILIGKTGLPICFVPEFLRERHASQDFLNATLLAVGTSDKDIFSLVCQCHSTLTKNSIILSTVEAELLKYYSNTFNATRVVFANIMYEVCQQLGADYSRVLDTYMLHGTASRDYLECSEDLRGFGGACLPKDTRAINRVIKQLGLNYKLFDSILQDNQQFKTTLRAD